MQQRPVFVYGTLQFREVAEAVTGRRLQAYAARLDGYARFQVRGEPFPGIVPASGASVHGLVYTGVDPAALERIDAFEGELYRRERITVAPGDDGEPLAAETYIVRRRWRSLLRDVDWDPDAFARDWLAAYVREVTRRRAPEASR